MTILRRRDFLKLAGAAGLSQVVPPVLAATDMDKAAKQGKVVFYANITAVSPIMKAFQEKTGIKAEYTRTASSKFLPTIQTEYGAGKLLADVVQAPRPMMQVLKDAGILAPYRSEAASDYPDWAVEDDDMTLFGVEYVSYLYNTEKVNKADAPKRYEDLAKPEWKDKIVMADPTTHASTISWLVGLKEQVFKSEDDWIEFLKALASNNPMFVASFGPTPAPVESGEKLLGISMPKYIITKAPAPLDWAPQMDQPLLGTARAIAVTKSAPRPEAARAFMDYWLSADAMGLLAEDVGEYVAAPGIHPPIDGMDKTKVRPVRDLSDEEIQKWGREFGTIFN